MKKRLFVGMMCLAALAGCLFTNCTEESSGSGGGSRGSSNGYVDLGLSSGTQWKSTNEAGGFYGYDEAINKFGSQMPSREQWIELVNECDWSWTGAGYRLVGPNGKTITLSAEGYRSEYGEVYGVGSQGVYWASTSGGAGLAWRLSFNSYDVRVFNDYRYEGLSVRLVRNN